MMLWLLAPAARCSFDAFRTTPLNSSSAPDQNPAGADRQRVTEAHGFFSTWGGATEQCYRRTPLLGQEDYKSWLLFGLSSAMVITWLLARLESRRRRTVR